jgi:hypothetical protein
LDGRSAWFGVESDIRLDTRRPEVRDHLSRTIARWLGVPVGATAPRWRYYSTMGEWGLSGATSDAETLDTRRHPFLSSIPLNSPDREALALAAVVRWLGDEVQAGRIQAPEVPHAP